MPKCLPLLGLFAALAAGAADSSPLPPADAAASAVPLQMQAGDELATGNEWISLPQIRAGDGAILTFNVLSMREHGLLQAAGAGGAGVLAPTLRIDGREVPLHDLRWSLLGDWIPVAQVTVDGIRLTITYCAPIGLRSAFVHVTARNASGVAAVIDLGARASWGSMQRVIYEPTTMHGILDQRPPPWSQDAAMFRFVTDDTKFAWVLSHPGAAGAADPLSAGYAAQRTFRLAPGAEAGTDFIVGVGTEEFSATVNARTLRRLLRRDGARAVIERTAAWCRQRTRATGRPDLDLLMNRNLLFTRFYAWGRTLDTETLVGVTSRSPRYYVAAAYWDRDAMLWSFPALLLSDTAFAREALDYALTTQLRNTGVHSRFIDGPVLEDGFELDEAAAPIVALASYERRTGDGLFLREHRPAIDALTALLGEHRAQSGLYTSTQDSQDEDRAQQFMTYDNALVWKAYGDLDYLYSLLHEPRRAASMRDAAQALRTAIMTQLVAAGAPGAGGPIFAFGSDGRTPYFDDVPPGSLLRLPLLGFVAESDPVYRRTYAWLHSANFRYSFADQPFGLPGSYRLPSTTVWSVADHLRLRTGRAAALKILLASHWDAGIATEGLDPANAAMRPGGGAFATAAGYLAAAICDVYCTDQGAPGRPLGRRAHGP